MLDDHLGSTGLTTDSNGNKISEIRYKPWGETRYTWTDAPANTSPAYAMTKYQYTGQFSYEAEFGLYFYNARWYDSQLGRFAQADTIIPSPGNSQAWDRFAYTLNNPVKYTDPSGNCASNYEDDPDCWDKANEIYNTYGVFVYPTDRAWDLTALAWLADILGEYMQFIGSDQYDQTIRGTTIFIRDVAFDLGHTDEEGDIEIDPDIFDNTEQGLSIEDLFKSTVAHELTHRWALKNSYGEETTMQSYGNATGWKDVWRPSWWSWIGDLFGQKWGYTQEWRSPGTGPTWRSNQGTPIEDLADTVSALIVGYSTENPITPNRLNWINENMRQE